MSFKLTVIIDKAKWEHFKLWANKRGSNASEQINQYIDGCLAGLYDTDDTDIPLDRKQQEEFWQLAQAKIEQSISELKDYVHAHTDGVIASAVKIAGEYTDERIEFYRSMGGGLGSSPANTDDTDKGTELFDTDGTDDTDEIGELNTDLADRPQLTYSDKEVFDLEPSIKSKTTVYRYRKGTSRPKDATFLDRWQVSPSGLKWLKREN